MPRTVAGVDVGSTAVKCVILDDAKTILATSLRPTGWAPREAAEEALAEALRAAAMDQGGLDGVVATGYGRRTVPEEWTAKVVTEIGCHARGARRFAPDATLVLDIGGQDSKAILVNEAGAVADFVMNDKCAAGTGRFVSSMATALGLDVTQLAERATEGVPVQLSSMCAVFAESEIIGCIARGVAPADLAAGVFLSIARRLKSLLGRFPPTETCLFTGGLAQNAHIAALFSRHLDMTVKPASFPQHAGAMGAALHALDA